MADISDRILTQEDFADKLGEEFVLSEDGNPPLALTLVECSPLPLLQQPPTGRRSFSLVFVADSRPMLPQRLYRLRQAGLGLIEIFLVPVGKDAHGFQYQAVFN